MRKEFIQLIRDRMMTLFIILVPGAQLLLLAQAVGRGITDLPIAILDRDGTAESRALTQRLENNEDLQWLYQTQSESVLISLLEQGQIVAALIIPEDFSISLYTGHTVAIPVYIDGTNSSVGASAQAYIENSIIDYYRNWQSEHGRVQSQSASLYPNILYNPPLRTRPFVIPAQMGFIIYQVTLIVAALSFARERELGTLEQLLVTPLRPLELVGGKAALAWLVGVFNFLLMYILVRLFFDIPMRGSFLLLFAFSVLFIIVEIAFGIIVSALSHSQQQAVLYIFLMAILDVALSGYLVPVKNMPLLLRLAATVSPLQHYLVIIRSIMLKGAGFNVLWPRAAALLGIGVCAAALAVRTVNRSLE